MGVIKQLSCRAVIGWLVFFWEILLAVIYSTQIKENQTKTGHVYKEKVRQAESLSALPKKTKTFYSHHIIPKIHGPDGDLFFFPSLVFSWYS